MHITPIIDYQKIADAQKFYKNHGFEEIAVPWVIQEEAYNSTRPEWAESFSTPIGFLNASGEQSFIELMLAGQIIARNLCITSCFRLDRDDALHQKYFVKVELIDTNVSLKNLQDVIGIAEDFYERYVDIEVIKTDQGEHTYDIVDVKNKIELGSYGIRKFRDFEWIYGTGLALPRLDTVINNQHNYV